MFILETHMFLSFSDDPHFHSWSSKRIEMYILCKYTNPYYLRLSLLQCGFLNNNFCIHNFILYTLFQYVLKPNFEPDDDPR